jgi:hypothetical protein
VESRPLAVAASRALRAVEEVVLAREEEPALGEEDGGQQVGKVEAGVEHRALVATLEARQRLVCLLGEPDQQLARVGVGRDLERRPLEGGSLREQGREPSVAVEQGARLAQALDGDDGALGTAQLVARDLDGGGADADEPIHAIAKDIALGHCLPEDVGEADEVHAAIASGAAASVAAGEEHGVGTIDRTPGNEGVDQGAWERRWPSHIEPFCRTRRDFHVKVVSDGRAERMGLATADYQRGNGPPENGCAHSCDSGVQRQASAMIS